MLLRVPFRKGRHFIFLSGGFYYGVDGGTGSSETLTGFNGGKGNNQSGVSRVTHLTENKLDKILNAEYAEVAVNNVFSICRAMDITLQDFYGEKLFDAENLLAEE